MNIYKKDCRLMGSGFTLGLVHESEKIANEFLDLGMEEIRRIEFVLSEFIESSDCSRINDFASETDVVVSRECFELVSRSMDISRLSKGDFDITTAPLKKLYHFKNSEFLFPDSSVLSDALSKTGYEKLILNKENSSIRFKVPGMKISFAAIGKGYAADCVCRLWRESGIRSGYINASGDLCAFGSKPDGQAWTIGIADPLDIKTPALFLPVTDGSVATSGDYIQHFTSSGKRYSHNINPHTGIPLSGISSVSVYSPSAELSDALATAVYVKGLSHGIEFVNQLPGTHCVIIDENGETFFSKNLQINEAA